MTKPYFCRVEYLESTGTQYIDTGIKSSGSLKVELVAESKTTSVSCNIFGVYSNTDDCFGIFQQASTLTYAAQYRYIGTDVGRIVSNVSSPNNKITAVLDKGAFYINGNLIGSKTYYNFSSTQNLLLFALNREPEAGIIGPNPAKIWICKIWDNDVLVRDFIPVLDNSGRPAMYDQVSGQLFYNQGTGEFNYGRQIIPVEYLESTGTQYIDTGYNPNQNTKVECKLYNPTNFDISKPGSILFGARNSGNIPTFTVIGNMLNRYGSRWDYGSDNQETYNYPLTVGEHVIVKDKQYNYLDGTLVSTNTVSSFSVDYSMHIFGTNTAGTNTLNFIGRYYNFKIYNSDILVRDFIPAIDENGVGFMFDNVSNTIYDNAGTGAFKFGPNAEKKGNKKLLRKKLALMLANLKKKRPFYTEIEYLEGTGTQYIDTGISGSSTLKIEMIAQKTGSSLGVYFGAGTGNNRIQAVYFSNYNNVRIGNINSNLGPDSEKFNVVVDALNKNVIYNGTSYPFAYTSALTNLNIFIFTRNEGGSYADKASAKCWSFKIWDNDILVRDFIPVLDWDYVPCMYDKVSGQLFYNQGTGNFTAGREIHPVDYIQTIYSSSGNSFIDTGYYPNFNTKVEFMASGISADSFAGSASGTWFTGGRQAYLQKMFGSYYNLSYQRLYFGFSTSLNDASYSTANMYGDNKKFVLDKTGLYINGTKIVNNTNTTAFTSPATLAIFGLNNNGTIISPTGMKIQYYKVWDNDVLTRDYIPMVDENGVGALFDKVTHTIYDAVGTGTGFKYPPVELEYLESDGTQYIDTGLTYFADFEIGIKLRESVSNKALGNGAYYCIQRNNVTSPYWQFTSGSGTGNYYNTTVSITEYHVMKWKDNKIYADDTFITSLTKSLNSNNPMLLFGAVSQYIYPNIIHFCKLWNPTDGTLVRDFIPCYKDGVLGMLDKVNSVFYQNAGTGTFATGKIVEDEYE